MTESQANQHFVGLLLSLHSSTWIHLGKVANPATGKPERNLPAAQEMIDLLGVIEEKTRGNRTSEEDKLMTQLLTELRMNYVDELTRSQVDAKKEPAPSDHAGDAVENADAPGGTSGSAAADAAAAPRPAPSEKDA